MACLLAPLCQAAPFDRPFTFTQPDGSTITLHGQGDEFHADFESLDGYSVIYDAKTRAHRYARLSPDGNTLLPTDLAVGRGDPASLGLKRHLRINANARKAAAAQRQQQWNEATGLTRRWKARKQKSQQQELQAAASAASIKADPAANVRPSPPAGTTTGTKVGLTLLVDFSDSAGTIDPSSVMAFCNGTGYTGYGNHGSVKEYFYDNSHGALLYTNIVTAYIRVPNPKSYYDNGTNDCGVSGRELLQDAIHVLTNLPAYASSILPSFGTLTTDDSSCVVACNIFYAGTVASGWSLGLWPHSYALAWPGLDLGNGKKVYAYQITDMGTSLSLGTFCHENGHMLCDFPDIYDYGGDSYGGAGMFCLMDYGGHGVNPVQICAYLKRASGWATTVNLTSSSVLTGTVSSAGADGNTFYRYAKPGVSTEYFLIENRQASGRDANLPASGIAIWHIDELGDRDNQSLTPNSSHNNYEVTLVQADNLWHFQNKANSGDSKDLYYQGNSATAYTGRFTDDSTPSARWWDGSSSLLYLANFAPPSTAMTFRVGCPYAILAATGFALTAENAVPFNQAVDPGETVTVAISLANQGGVATTNLIATLLPVGGITTVGSAQSYGAIAPGASATRSYMFTATGTCGATAMAVLQLQDGAYSYGQVTNSFTLGFRPAIFTQNFDLVSAPTLPAGWSNATSGAGAAWVTTLAVSDTAPNSAFSPGVDAVGQAELRSPPLTNLAIGSQLSFRHCFAMETYYDEYCDGGVLELRIDAGGWQDILTAGGSFVSNGYNATISTSYGNPLAGRPAWSGSSGGFTSCTVNLPATVAGASVQFRWLQAFDINRWDTGWYIDSVQCLTSWTNAPAPSAFQTWRFWSFGNVTGVNTTAEADWDGDGLSNTNEFLCGTSATNATSRLAFESAPLYTINGYTVTWQCTSGKTYQVAYTPSLTNSWQTNLPGSLLTAGGSLSSMTYTDTTSGISTSNRFYRILLVP